ncbi:dihydrodipicolinate synthase family protein [Brevibacterium pityocampae]
MYDNPGTTGFRFSLDLYARLARIPGVAAVKIPPTDGTDAPPAQRLARIRESVGEGFAIGISGDAAAAAHLAAGADAWHSVVAGLFPHAARRLVDAAGTGAEGTGTALSDAVPADTGQSDAVPADTVQSGTAPPDELEVLRPLLAAHGSVRVMAAAAAELGLVAADCLPHPLLPLDGADREAVVAAVRSLAAR